MKQNLTEITILHDCCKTTIDSEKQVLRGYEKLFASQKHKDLKTMSSIISYSGTYEVLFDNLPIDKINLTSLGNCQTGEHPVIDSISTAINDLGQRYSNTDPSFHPENVIIVITSFGKDNASKQFTIDVLRPMISHQTEVYKWKFFILTDEKEMAEQLGISNDNTVIFELDNNMFFENAINNLISKINELRNI